MGYLPVVLSLNLLHNGDEIYLLDNVTELFQHEFQCSLMQYCNLGI